MEEQISKKKKEILNFEFTLHHFQHLSFVNSKTLQFLKKPKFDRIFVNNIRIEFPEYKDSLEKFLISKNLVQNHQLINYSRTKIRGKKKLDCRENNFSEYRNSLYFLPGEKFFNFETPCRNNRQPSVSSLAASFRP